ncbi:MAG: EamA family transporter [Bacteroidota bacterium]
MKLALTERQRAYLDMHISILFFGFAAILGKLISLPGTSITFYRMLITLISLCFFPGLIKRCIVLPSKTLIRYSGIGILMALHWMTFFESIKYANASIAVTCMASVAFFTSLIEPIFFKKKISRLEMVLGLIVIGGILMIFGFTGEKYALGIVLALISALLISLVSVLNKQAVAEHDVYSITSVQFAAGVLFLAFLMPFYIQVFPNMPYLPNAWDWLWLLILSLLGTTLAYTLNMRSLKHLSAYITMLSMNLEPVYGIILAWLIFREDKELNFGFYIGAFIILTAVFIHPILDKKTDKA